ncbi:putative glycosyl transferase family protein [Listeria weihenstephanensis FSL R9-0317]|uniref:glycosyltransferase n=1 Tax=Listeria weihenstephanensis TaxID=1006155 RepID=UPI0003E8624B|nr:glycosyltransferase [Listeria weihenstephanensis]EUJ35027.1 putative glycosyl transferase family protein [Listeria weihenstephanensis FSL R9-0317]
MPSISIILPVYNVAPYLEACLDSLVAQTYQDFDVIAVNDGSQDGSLAILEAYQAKLPQLRVISQQNQGLSAARNTGLKHVSGKYLYFLDSDDYLQHDMLARCFALAEQEQLDLVKFDAEPFTEDGVMTTNPYDSSAVLQEDKIYTQKEWLVAQHKHYNSPVWLFFIRTALVLNNKMTFVDNLLHEDEIFTPQLFTKVERVMYIRQTFFKRRYRKGSIMQNNIYYSRASYDSKKRVIRLLDKEKSMVNTSAAKRFFKSAP